MQLDAAEKLLFPDSFPVAPPAVIAPATICLLEVSYLIAQTSCSQYTLQGITVKVEEGESCILEASSQSSASSVLFRNGRLNLNCLSSYHTWPDLANAKLWAQPGYAR